MQVPITKGRRLDVGTWTYGLLSDFIQGGANSIGAGFGAIAFDPTDFNFQSGKLYGLMGSVFLFNAVLKAAAYLAGHPLPTVVNPEIHVIERSPHTSTETIIKGGTGDGSVIDTITKEEK